EHERVYSLQRRGKPCDREASALASFAAARSYRLLAIHARLDEVTCLTRGPERDSMDLRGQLAQEAVQSGFESLALRALGFLCERHVGSGRPLSTWNLGREGLVRFWSSMAPALRAHQFYYSLAEVADGSGLPFAAAVLAGETERVLRDNPNAATWALAMSKA